MLCVAAAVAGLGMSVGQTGEAAAQGVSKTHLSCGYYVVYGAGGASRPATGPNAGVMEDGLALEMLGDGAAGTGEGNRPKGPCRGPNCSPLPESPGHGPLPGTVREMFRTSMLMIAAMPEFGDAGELLFVAGGDEAVFACRYLDPPDPPPCEGV